MTNKLQPRKGKKKIISVEEMKEHIRNCKSKKEVVKTENKIKSLQEGLIVAAGNKFYIPFERKLQPFKEVPETITALSFDTGTNVVGNNENMFYSIRNELNNLIFLGMSDSELKGNKLASFDSDIYALEYCPEDKATYVGTYGGLYRYFGWGKTEPITKALKNMTALKFHNGKLYAGCNSGKLYTVDVNKKKNKLTQILEDKHIGALESDNENLYYSCKNLLKKVNENNKSIQVGERYTYHGKPGSGIKGLKKERIRDLASVNGILFDACHNVIYQGEIDPKGKSPLMAPFFENDKINGMTAVPKETFEKYKAFLK